MTSRPTPAPTVRRVAGALGAALGLLVALLGGAVPAGAATAHTLPGRSLGSLPGSVPGAPSSTGTPGSTGTAPSGSTAASTPATTGTVGALRAAGATRVAGTARTHRAGASLSPVPGSTGVLRDLAGSGSTATGDGRGTGSSPVKQAVEPGTGGATLTGPPAGRAPAPAVRTLRLDSLDTPATAGRSPPTS